MTTMTTPMTRRRALLRRGAVGLGGAALVLGAGFAAAPAQAADTGVSTLEQIKSCESGGNYSAVNASSGASGAYQFLDSTWQSLSASAGYSTAASAPESVQDAAALELYNTQGTSPWAASESCWASASGESTSSTTSSADSTTASTAESSTASTDSSQTSVTVQDVATTETAGASSEQASTTPSATAEAPATGAVQQPIQGAPAEQAVVAGEFGQAAPAQPAAGAPAGDAQVPAGAAC